MRKHFKRMISLTMLTSFFLLNVISQVRAGEVVDPQSEVLFETFEEINEPSVENVNEKASGEFGEILLEDSSDVQAESDEELLETEGEVADEAQGTTSSAEQTPSESQTPSDGQTPSESQTPLEGQIPEDGELDAAANSDGVMITNSSPYSGEYLFMFNKRMPYYSEGASVGSMPSSSVEGLEEALEEAFEEAALESEGNGIFAYDEDGEAILESNKYDDVQLVELTEEEEEEFLEGIESEESLEYVLNQTKSIYLQVASYGYAWVDCVCVSVGDHCTVWVPADDPIYVASPSKMAGYMNTIRDNFEANYQNVVNNFGSFYYADYYGDKDGKTALVCYDISGNKLASGAYTAGYFWGADLNFIYGNCTGNNMDLLHIDSWQGMSRSSTDGSATLKNVSGCMGTSMHELQHMVFWGNCREVEKRQSLSLGSVSAPTWINEGFAEAANHLCNGALTSRITHFNSYFGSYQNSQYDGLYSPWASSGSTLYRYDLSYLFMQYVRTQYAQTSAGRARNGWEIYLDSFSKINNSYDDVTQQKSFALVDAMASCVGVSTEELMRNFWIAIYAKTANGKYGFNGETFADKVKLKTASSKSASIYPGCVQILPLSGFLNASGNSPYVDVVGVDKNVQQQVAFTVTESEAYGERYLTLNVQSPAGARVYYNTVNGGIPTTSDTDLTLARTFRMSTPGTYYHNFLAVDPDGNYGSGLIHKTVTVQKSTEPSITFENIPGNASQCKVTIKGYESNQKIYYTLDSTSPNMQSTEYTASINVTSGTTVKAIVAGMGKAVSDVVSVKAVHRLEMPNVSSTSFRFNKRQSAEYRTAKISLSSQYNDLYGQCDLTGTGASYFALTRDRADQNNWTLSILNNNLPTKVYYLNFRIPISESVADGYYTKPITITVVDTAASVTVSTPQLNYCYVPPTASLSVRSSSGTVEIIGLEDGTTAGFTENFKLVDFDQNGHLDSIQSIPDAMEDLMKSGKSPVTSGYLRVQVEGYEEQLVPLSVKLIASTLKITASPTKPNISTTPTKVTFTLSASGKGLPTQDVTSLTRISYDTTQKTYAAFATKLLPYIDHNSGTTAWFPDEKVLTFGFKSNNGQTLPEGSYTIPLVLTGSTNGNNFSKIHTSVSFTVQSEKVVPKVTLSSTKVLLNKDAMERKTISATCNRQDLYVVMDVSYAPTTRKVNIDRGVNAYATKDKLDVYFDQSEACNGSSYSILLTPRFYRINDDSLVNINAKPIKLAVTVNHTTPTVNMTQKGSVDVINRSGTGMTYTVKSVNFGNDTVENPYAAGAVSVAMAPADYNYGIKEIDGSSMFEVSQLSFKPSSTGYPLKGGTMIVRAKDNVQFEKGKVYVIRLKFANIPTFLGNGKAAYSQVLKITPTQTTPKFTMTRITALNRANLYWDDYRDVTLTPKTGAIESMSWNSTKNAKYEAYFSDTTVVNSPSGTTTIQLLDPGIKKGTYKLYYDVKMKGAMSYNGAPVTTTVAISVTVK